jgi:hypothetical protein
MPPNCPGTIAWIAWWSAADCYTGYIGRIDEDGREVELLEQMPDFREIELVLSWARERSPHVRIRPEWDEAAYYWAGEESQNPGLPLLVCPGTDDRT